MAGFRADLESAEFESLDNRYYSLNSVKGVILGTTIGVIKGATRSLDSSSHVVGLEGFCKSGVVTGPGPEMG